MTYLCFGSILESIDTGIENRGFFFNSFMPREYRVHSTTEEEFRGDKGEEDHECSENIRSGGIFEFSRFHPQGRVMRAQR